jgi:hypothetical protein
MAKLTEEQTAKAAADKAAKEATAAALKTAKAAAPKVKVNFGIEIPGVGKFTKEEIEADADIQNHLLEIGSGAVTKL